MTGIDLKEVGKKNPAVARATAIVGAVNSVAKLLRDFRLKRGLSQADMADKLGVSQPRIAQLESGKPGNAPSLEQLAEYAFHAGNDLLICDRSQARELPEYKTLLRKIESLEKRIRELENQRAPASRTMFVRIPATGQVTAGSARTQPGHRPYFGSRVPLPVIPIPVSGDKDQTSGHLIGMYRCDDVVISAGSESEVTVSAGDIVEQWTHWVPKVTLKQLARLLEASANATQKTSAYDVLTIIYEAMGTIVQAESPPTLQRPKT